MSGNVLRHPGQLERELAYYQRECNDLGARLLGLQEEQSRAFREARRSRMVAKLIREAYRLADAGSSPAEIGLPMLGVIVENAMCDAAAFLAENHPGSGEFVVTDVVGVGRPSVQDAFFIADPPPSFFTTSRSQSDPAPHELTNILSLPYVFWAYDRASGHALVLGNRSESNINRAFEAGDQELIEGALSVYLDVLSRKQAEFGLRQAQASIEAFNDANAVFLSAVSEEFPGPLNEIIDHSDHLRDAMRSLQATAGQLQHACDIHEAGRHLLSMAAELSDYGRIARGLAPMKMERLGLAGVIDEAAQVNAAFAAARQISVLIRPVDPALAMTADRFRLRLLLRTLVSKAIHAAPAGSVVMVEALQDRNGAAEIAVRASGAAFLASPEKSGGPSAVEHFAGGGAGVHAGPGLRLPIARELCQAHGGWLVLEGAPDRGAVMRAVFPNAGVAR